MSPRVVWMMAPRGSVAAAAPPSSSTGTSSSAVGFSLKTSLQTQSTALNEERSCVLQHCHEPSTTVPREQQSSSGVLAAIQCSRKEHEPAEFIAWCERAACC